VNRSSGDSYFDVQAHESSTNIFDSVDFEDVNAFFDSEPPSGIATPRGHEASSKASLDFGNAWNSFQPLSPPSSGVLPSDDWQYFGQGQVPHNILTQIDPSRVRTQHGQTTPPDEDTSSSLEYQLAPQQYGLPSPESSTSSSGTSNGSKRKQSSGYVRTLLARSRMAVGQTQTTPRELVARSFSSVIELPHRNADRRRRNGHRTLKPRREKCNDTTTSCVWYVTRARRRYCF